MPISNPHIVDLLRCFLAVAAGVVALGSTAATAATDRCEVHPRSSHVVSVRDKGAKGDGKSDDTDAIAAAIKEVAGSGGTVLLPRGTYMVDAVDKDRRLKLGDDMTFRLAEGATLKVIPNDAGKYALLTIAAASKVTVAGTGALRGDRHEHKGKGGEWGMGIKVESKSRNITITGVTVSGMWGDGIYVGGAIDVAVCGVTADNNRRQGLSIVSVDGILVRDSVFKNTKGTRPAAGIDLEPNSPDDNVANVRIIRSQFLDNAGGGIFVNAKRGQIENIDVANNVFRGNKPVLIANAPAEITSKICRNRQLTKQEVSSAGFNPYAASLEVPVLQSDCENIGLEVRRGKVKKPADKSR